MSKVIFLGLGAHGHINPTLGVVSELVAQGEEVVYYCMPEFRSKIEATGARFREYRVEVGQPSVQGLRSDTNIIDIWRKSQIYDLDKLIQRFSDGLSRTLMFMNNPLQNLQDEISEYGADYMIHDSHAYWGKILAKRLNIPAISSISLFAFCEKIFELYPDFVLRDVLWLADQYLANPEAVKKVLRRASKMIGSLYKVPEYDYMDAIFPAEPLNIVYTSKEFQWYGELFDSRFQFVGPSFYSRNEGDDFPWNDLHPGPLIYISLGTNIYDASFYRKCFEAFGTTGQPVLLNIGDFERQALGDIPPNFRVRNFVPQLEVLKRTALFITHGGMNSVNESLYFNVPMVVIPQAWDQPIVAQRVKELGAGIAIENIEFQAQDLYAAAQTVLNNNSYRERCRIIGESLRSSGGYKRAVDEIFRFKAERGIN